MSFAKNLRTERKKLGLSAEELAKRAGISRSYITLLENDRRPPTKSIIAKIAKGLGVKSWLVEEWFFVDQLKNLGIKDRKTLYKLKLVIEPFLRTIHCFSICSIMKETSLAQEPFDFGV